MGLVALGFAGLVVTAALREGAAYTAVGEQAAITWLASSTPTLPLSTRSTEHVLDECYLALTSLVGQLQPSAVRASVSENCRQFAQEVVASAPSFSYAWLIIAQASAELGDLTRLYSAAEISWTVAPSEAWLAELRSELLLSRIVGLPVKLGAIAEADLRTLLVSQNGPATVARLFVRHVTARDIIAHIAQQTSGSAQRRFLAALNQLTQP